MLTINRFGPYHDELTMNRFGPCYEGPNIAFQIDVTKEGNKHNSNGDETPPIPEEELEQQKIEHERQLQKEKACQAKEAEEVRQLDMGLLQQRAIEAEDEQRGVARMEQMEDKGINNSWSHHRLCDLQRNAARWRYSRPSITDAKIDNDSKGTRGILKKSISIQLTQQQSSRSIDSDGIVFNVRGKDEPSIYEECSEEPIRRPRGASNATCGWRSSTSDVRPRSRAPLFRAPSCPGSRMRGHEMPCKGPESGGKEGSQLSRSESTVSRCTPATPLGLPDSASVDSNPMSTIYRCRAPIASLDCMDDFSANSQQMLDQAGDITMPRQMMSYLANHGTASSSVTPGLRYKNLGKSGLRVSNIGLGLWCPISDEAVDEIVGAALDSGITLFDLSEAHYGKGDIELGKALRKRGVKRTSVIITTKIYWSTKSDERGLSRKHIVESVQTSLSKLQMDYIDVVLLHKVDPVCPMEEIVRAMNFVINQGWVMYWGTARWTPTEIMDAYTNCRQFNCITPIVEQTEYQMFCREKPELYMPELYHKIGVGMMVWSASTTGKGLTSEDTSALFAKSRFNRKYSTFSWCENEENTVPAELRSFGSKDQVTAEEQRSYADKLHDLNALATSLNCTLSQLAVAWCLKNESVNCLLLGATSAAQFKENIHALQIVPQLTLPVMAEIERLLSNKPLRPPMVSTLAMRNQQNTVRIDMAGESGAGTPKPEGDGVIEGEASSPTKETGRSFCEIQ